MTMFRRNGALLLAALLDSQRASFTSYADCVNMCLVFAGLRPGCRLECRDWDVDALRGIFRGHPSVCVVSPWLRNTSPPGSVHVLFSRAAVRPVDVQALLDENTDDSPRALAAYRRVLGYPCGFPAKADKRFRASVMMILKHTGTTALHSVLLLACVCPTSRYSAAMKHMEQFASKATRLMGSARLGEYALQGFACCDS